MKQFKCVSLWGKFLIWVLIFQTLNIQGDDELFLSLKNGANEAFLKFGPPMENQCHPKLLNLDIKNEHGLRLEKYLDGELG